LVVGAYLFGIVAWLFGIYYALSDRESPLPLFGRLASRLPIQ